MFTSVFTGCDDCNSNDANASTAESNRDIVLGNSLVECIKEYFSIISGFDGNIINHDAHAPDRNSDLGKILDSLLIASFVLNTSTDECTNIVESWNDDELSDYDILLTEDDIPGASLKGKHPKELNVVELKRWLACRGAPQGGKKPELINR